MFHLSFSVWLSVPKNVFYNMVKANVPQYHSASVTIIVCYNVVKANVSLYYSVFY